MKNKVTLTPESDVSSEVSGSEAHCVTIRIDRANNDVYFECASREALYEFGKSLMGEALFGSGQLELYPLGFKGSWLVVNGVRLTEGSSRVFVFSPPKV